MFIEIVARFKPGTKRPNGRVCQYVATTRPESTTDEEFTNQLRSSGLIESADDVLYVKRRPVPFVV